MKTVTSWVQAVVSTVEKALGSRKFVAAATAFAAAIHAGKSVLAAGVAAAYLVSQGYVDSKAPKP